MNTVTVKVAVLGQSTKELFLAEGATVESALAAAEVAVPANHELRVGPTVANRTQVLTDGAIITIVPANIKGGR
jgi:hypothetical protein